LRFFAWKETLFFFLMLWMSLFNLKIKEYLKEHSDMDASNILINGAPKLKIA
jgi:hypothetical protein